MKRTKRRRGFTDRLYRLNLSLAWIYTSICVILSIFGGNLGIEDYSFVSVVCPLVWGEVAVHSAFIIRKAWLENLNKHNLIDKDNTGGLL